MTCCPSYKQEGAIQQRHSKCSQPSLQGSQPSPGASSSSPSEEDPVRRSPTSSLASGAGSSTSSRLGAVGGNEGVGQSEGNPADETSLTRTPGLALGGLSVVQMVPDKPLSQEGEQVTPRGNPVEGKRGQGSVLPEHQGLNSRSQGFTRFLGEAVEALGKGLRVISPNCSEVRRLHEALSLVTSSGYLNAEDYCTMVKGFAQMVEEVQRGTELAAQIREGSASPRHWRMRSRLEAELRLMEEQDTSKPGKVPKESQVTKEARKVPLESVQPSTSQGRQWPNPEDGEPWDEVPKGQNRGVATPKPVASNPGKKPARQKRKRDDEQEMGTKRVDIKVTPKAGKAMPSAPLPQSHACTLRVTGPKSRPYSELKNLLRERYTGAKYTFTVDSREKGVFFITPQDPASYKMLTGGLKKGKLNDKYHFNSLISREERRSNYASSLNKHLRTVVLVGIELSEDLIEEFKKANIGVLACKEIHTKDGKSTGKCWVELEDMDVAQSIKTQGYMLLDTLKIRVQPYELGPRPKRCYRCQSFRHLAKACREPPKCSRCTEGHLTKQCPRFRKAQNAGHPAPEVLKCANCGGEHKTNADFCKVYLANKKHLTWAQIAKKGAKRTPAPAKQGAKGPNRGKASPPSELATVAGLVGKLQESLTSLQQEVRALKAANP